MVKRLVDLGVHVIVSLDGSAGEHDANRRTRHGRGSQAKK
jgi:sulfatase maturation enzyme AslB (radical SAM superfamily)